jgi:N-acetylglucosaminyldiphosphoundecaprenol N-acetyl-beta-D-mannosaminyltransferase
VTERGVWPQKAAKAPGEGDHHVLEVLGVRIVDLSIPEALELMERWIRDPRRPTRRLYFVNAHSLNLAEDEPGTREILNSADAVFGDGTGVRWAARAQGIRIKDNLNGTDLVPLFFKATAGRGYRYYLLGAEVDVIERAAAWARAHFPGWEGVGHHTGYLTPETSRAVVDEINALRPDMLLVGMGQSRQERWLSENREALNVPLCIGVGGLLDYWGGDLRRAFPWVRKLGFEWLQLLLQQPHKGKRYLIGNPKFLYRIARETLGGKASDG